LLTGDGEKRGGQGAESCDRKKAWSSTEQILQYSLLVAYRRFEEFNPIGGWMFTVQPRTVLCRKNKNIFQEIFLNFRIEKDSAWQLDIYFY
jgi:hypothetical protein